MIANSPASASIVPSLIAPPSLLYVSSSFRNSALKALTGSNIVNFSTKPSSSVTSFVIASAAANAAASSARTLVFSAACSAAVPISLNAFACSGNSANAAENSPVKNKLKRAICIDIVSTFSLCFLIAAEAPETVFAPMSPMLRTNSCISPLDANSVRMFAISSIAGARSIASFSKIESTTMPNVVIASFARSTPAASKEENSTPMSRISSFISFMPSEPIFMVFKSFMPARPKISYAIDACCATLSISIIESAITPNISSACMLPIFCVSNPKTLNASVAVPMPIVTSPTFFTILPKALSASPTVKPVSFAA